MPEILAYAFIVAFGVLIWPALVVTAFSMAFQRLIQSEGFGSEVLAAVKSDQMGRRYVNSLGGHALLWGLCMIVFAFSKWDGWLWVLGVLTFLTIVSGYRGLVLLRQDVRTRFRRP
jgi:hypothetical protein